MLNLDSNQANLGKYAVLGTWTTSIKDLESILSYVSVSRHVSGQNMNI